MKEKNTTELQEILQGTHPENFQGFLADHQQSMYGENEFFDFFKDLLHEKGITQQRLFIDADIPERYGYKILSGEKRTRQRDLILRLCYAAEFTLEETQRALRMYGLPELYAKKERDASLVLVFSHRPGSVIDVNSYLKENGLEPLRTSGVQD